MKRAVCAIIRLSAAGLILVGGMELGLEFLRHYANNGPVSRWHCVLGAVLVALGIILLAMSSRLAERLADDFEE